MRKQPYIERFGIARFKVSLVNFVADAIAVPFSELPDVRDNGMHEQLDGFALVSFICDDSCGPFYRILHPKTGPENCITDVIFGRDPNSGYPKTGFYIIGGDGKWQPLDFTDQLTLKRVWPEKNPWSLFEVIRGVEKYPSAIQLKMLETHIFNLLSGKPPVFA